MPRDLNASVAFSRDRLGLRETGRGKGGRIAHHAAGPWCPDRRGPAIDLGGVTRAQAEAITGPVPD